MNVLVLTAMYPTLDGKRPQYYVHSRNLYYAEYGINVTVLNFASAGVYTIDGIKVIDVKEYKKHKDNYDLIICHAANLRNHYRFLKVHGHGFQKIMFVFHGHEILHINKYYPQPFDYVQRKVPAFVQDLYDSLKISLWKHYILQNVDKIRMVYVSKWLFKQFCSETGLSGKQLKGRYTIISNSVGKFFEENQYSQRNLKYDFITIRANMDGSKYGVDIAVSLAREHPEYRFLIIGKGEYFHYNTIPPNVEWVEKELSHEDMAQYINASKVALLPTREDTQGLIACELATYGIPLITSNIEVCHEVFENCPNIAFIDNHSPNLKKALASLKLDGSKNKWMYYYAQNTVLQEIQYIKDIIEDKK